MGKNARFDCSKSRILLRLFPARKNGKHLDLAKPDRPARCPRAPVFAERQGRKSVNIGQTATNPKSMLGGLKRIY